MKKPIVDTTARVMKESKFWGVDSQGFGDFTHHKEIKVTVPNSLEEGTKVNVLVYESSETPDHMLEYNKFITEMFMAQADIVSFIREWNDRLVELFEHAHDTEKAVKEALDEACNGCARDEREPVIPMPVEGEDIYVPTCLYLGHGRDDKVGGLGKIVKIKINDNETVLEYNKIFVMVEEFPGTWWNWRSLLDSQDKYAKEFENKRAYPDPDLRPDMNVWE